MRFIKNHPALFFSDRRILAVADLHIGLAHDLQKSGIKIPSQTEKMKKEIMKLIKKTKTKILIILGDIKHEVPGMSYQEEKEIPLFLEYLSQKVEVKVCLGNHDTFLKRISPKNVAIYGSEGFAIGKYGFFHGHAWPSKDLLTCDILIMSHTHPVVQFTDKLGYRIVQPVWIRGKIKRCVLKERYGIKKIGKLELIVMPSFNSLLGGIPVNIQKQNKMIGPLMNNRFVDLEGSEIYLLDGTYLGTLKDL